MKLFNVFNIKVRLDITMLFLALVWIFSGNGITFLTVSLVVILHELAHALTARLFGIETESITLYLFGGEAKIGTLEGDYAKECVIAAAGPLISLFIGFLWQLGSTNGILFQWDEFTRYSFSISLINLLPVYPLDGGRIFNSVTCALFGKRKGRRLTLTVGIIIAVIMLIKCTLDIIFYKKSTGIIMSIFIFTASLRAIKKPQGISLREGKWNKADRIKFIKANENESLLNVSRSFFGNCFFTVVIFDDRQNVTGILTEKQITEYLILNNRMTLKEACLIRQGSVTRLSEPQNP